MSDVDNQIISVGWAKLVITGAATLVIWAGTLVGMYSSATRTAHDETAVVANDLRILTTEKAALVQKRDEQVADIKSQLSEMKIWKETFASTTANRFATLETKIDVMSSTLNRIDKKLDNQESVRKAGTE